VRVDHVAAIDSFVIIATATQREANMSSATALLALIALAVPSRTQENAAVTSRPIAITHVAVIDATGAPAKADTTVVITDGRISSIGPSAQVKAPDGAQVVDATGKFLIPGLWDMHVHWYLERYLTLFIANGVTGVRQMWGVPMHQQWRDKIERGDLVGPRMVIASRIVDGPKPIWPGSATASDEAQGRAAVVEAKRAGADFVKVYSLLPREAFLGIADEAKKQGIPFAGHVPLSVALSEASDAGMKCVEHLTGVVSACSSREDELLKAAREAVDAAAAAENPMLVLNQPRVLEFMRIANDSYSAEKAAALFAQLKRNGTWQCPTLTVLHNTAFIDDPALASDPRLKYIPAKVKGAWDPTKDPRFKDRPAERLEFEKKSFPKKLEIVGAMQRAGVGILAGTDTLNPYCMPGFSLHGELGFLVQSGLTPMEALQSATIAPARFLGMETELGTVEKGKLADLVLLRGNPLDDIRNTQKIEAVIARGRLFERNALDEMLTQAEADAKK
jgi:imidazolonepropionase-like amidohydrolase